MSVQAPSKPTQKQTGKMLIELHRRVASISDQYNTVDPGEKKLQEELNELRWKLRRTKTGEDGRDKLKHRKEVVERRLSLKQDARRRELNSAIIIARDFRRGLENRHSISADATRGAVTSARNGLPGPIVTTLLS
jgi:hypothetical protein